ncbi:MAG: hypothetical protein WD271_09660 [Acidimicrobiia bacterium]
MFHVSRFTPDQAWFAEFLACLWQGDVPASLQLVKWLYLPGEPRAMLLLWEGDDDARAYVDRAFGNFGALDTEIVTDATPGLAAALARDLDAFGRHMEASSATSEAIAAALDVRRRGMDASSQDDAATAGRAWAAEQADREGGH